ncbi:MAG: disulfide bond formation protein B [Acidimicrobiales bacterium]
MNADQVADVFGTLASAGVLAMLALPVLYLVAPATFAAVRSSLRGSGPALGGAVALVAMAGSLWFSKGAHFPPCELCWYQRIAIYPLAVILPLGAWRGDVSTRRSGLALAGIGIVVSAWHNVIETFPSVDAGGCDPANPCTLRWVAGLGFWTIPRMAFVAFSLIIVALLLDAPDSEQP